MEKNKNTNEKKKLGVAELACYGIGNCIGSGIFVSMGSGIAFTGHSITLALVAANLVVLFAYAYKTLMAGMFVLPGGAYSQAALLQPPLLVGVTALSTILPVWLLPCTPFPLWNTPPQCFRELQITAS